MLKNIYYKIPKNSILRKIIFQIYLMLLHLFNFSLNIVPFPSIKKMLCIICGMKIGRNANLCSGIRFLAFGNFEIGDCSIINRNCLIDNRDKIVIGKNVSVATGVSIFTKGHDIEDADFCMNGAPVSIEDYSCIYASSLIMPGINIGFGSVIYPGSVVTKSVERMTVVGGNPAKVLKKRYSIPGYKLSSNFMFS
jgi:maltose O-acetyltransferase